MKRACCGLLAIAFLFAAQSLVAAPFIFETNVADGAIAMRSEGETEAADDLVIPIPVSFTGATFVGLVPGGASVSRVDVSIYRVFPVDSDTGRTPAVPTRVNSPADEEFESRSSVDGSLAFTTTVLNPTFFAANSVLNGIAVGTGGEGAVTGEQVRLNVTFAKPLSLPAGHYFFVPQAQLSTGHFLWLSSPRPIVAPGTPFTPDLQTWIRNGALDPDWLRVGTDVVGAGAFNGTFSMTGEAFSTGNANGAMAMASRPESAGNVEIEAADDFVLDNRFAVERATFVGLMPVGASVSRVAAEIYRVFPADSDTSRTIHVPTRVSSPADNALAVRDTADGSLSFTKTIVATAATAANSVLNGINPSPNQTTGGEGALSGQRVQFDIEFSPPILLDSGHYFFVPQVQLGSGNFYWLSAPKPIVPPGTPFSADLQTWIRNGDLDPDWLRVGTDIVGSGAFNGTFTLAGDVLTPLELEPVHLWIGLRNSDDIGTQFDIKAEVLKNGTPIASGIERCITGVTRNPLLAKEAVIHFDPFTPVFVGSGDEIALKLGARIGTNPDGTKCSGPGGSHNSASGLRVYYDSKGHASGFVVDISPSELEDLFMHSDGSFCGSGPSKGVTKVTLDPVAPAGTKDRCLDWAAIRAGPFQDFPVVATYRVP